MDFVRQYFRVDGTGVIIHENRIYSSVLDTSPLPSGYVECTSFPGLDLPRGIVATVGQLFVGPTTVRDMTPGEKTARGR